MNADSGLPSDSQRTMNDLAIPYPVRVDAVLEGLLQS